MNEDQRPAAVRPRPRFGISLRAWLVTIGIVGVGVGLFYRRTMITPKNAARLTTVAQLDKEDIWRIAWSRDGTTPRDSAESQLVRALSSNPTWFLLNYNGPNDLQTDRNREIVRQKWGYLMTTAPAGSQLDEYPYASTRQGGRNALGAPVPAWQNRLQGGLLSALYRYSLKSTKGRPFLVVPVPL